MDSSFLTILYNKLINSILAGICIALGASLYLKVGGVLGAFLFSVGLLCVISNQYCLFTGKAYLIKEWKWLILYLIGNIIGCYLVSLLPIELDVTNIITTRVNTSWINAGLLGIGCGFLMSEAVRSKNNIAVILCVGTFILCGFYHCIADSYYYLIARSLFSKEVLPVYVSTVVGNFIGCNICNLKLIWD